MGISKALVAGGMSSDMPDEDTDIEVHEMDDAEGTTFSFGGDDEQKPPPEFSSNLAEYVSDETLAMLETEIKENFENDLESRREWENVYRDGLDLLGIKSDDRVKPWPGACGVYHPVLTEAVVRFEAQAIMEIFPPQGPAKTSIIGAEDAKKLAQARRVQDELNYILTTKMTDYRDETETMLFQLPLAGSAFRKIYYDTTMRRPSAKFVAAENFVIAYGESDIRSAARYTFVDDISKNTLKKRQVSGFYRDISLQDEPYQPTQIENQVDDITGIRPTMTVMDRYTICEQYTYLDLEGFEDKDADGEDTGIGLPYIVSFHKETGKILAIYRNWNEKDQNKDKKEYFVHYKYLPGLGFYGFGLIHLVGGVAKSSTSILRQLVDAGTLCNLPGGLKSRDLRIKGDDSPIRPGEFRDVDVPGGTIRDSIAFIPYKEPSTVLYQLLGNIVDEARRIGSIADLDIGDMKQEAPVGTTLALMERALKVMSAVQARVHYSLEQELRLIAQVVATFMPPNYEYQQDGQYNRQQDLSDVNIIPVSDPGASTMAQRVVQYQAVIQLASQNPQLYDMRKLNLDMLNVLGIKDANSLVPDPGQMQPTDPVTENQNILNGAPVKAFQDQDQDAHLKVHLGMINDPQIKALVGQSPKAGIIESAAAAHVAEHLGFKYRQQIEQQLGASLPPMGQPLPPDLEVQISRLVAQAAPAVLQQSQSEAAQQQAQQAAQDPLVQLQQQELAIKQAQVSARSSADHARIMSDAAKAQQQHELGLQKLATQREIAAANIKSHEAETVARFGHEKRTQEREITGDLVRDHNQQVMDHHTTLAKTGLDIAGKVAVEAMKPTPEPKEPKGE